MFFTIVANMSTDWVRSRLRRWQTATFVYNSSIQHHQYLYDLIFILEIYPDCSVPYYQLLIKKKMLWGKNYPHHVRNISS